MSWNWQLPGWPNFSFETDRIIGMERQFLLKIGSSTAYLKNIDQNEYHQFVVEILSQEGSGSSKIEGELLDRESLQSSIKRHFGLITPTKVRGRKESLMADLLCDVYETFHLPLSHEMLWRWHAMLFDDQAHLDDKGKYRTHPEPMQIISNRYDKPTVFFEAPPSAKVFDEMTAFISWFNSIKETGTILGHVAIAHVYFESIHPFEDGNGRIGRALIEKLLSQYAGRPVLIAVSKVLEESRKEYYAALGTCNRTLDANTWVEFFSQAVLQAMEQSGNFLHFLLEKSKLMNRLTAQINPREEKALMRMFECGIEGFQGGMSAENYIKITKASRATATRDLTHLVELGALVKTGELKYTRYWLSFTVKDEKGMR